MDPQTLALQRALLAQGYALPRWGADGHMGAETLAACAAWARDHGHPPDAPLASYLPALLAGAPAGSVILGGRTYPLPGVVVRQERLGPDRAHFSPRRSSDYRGIILHHDACLSAAQCVAVFRDARERARAGKKANRASTHFIIDNDASIVQLADPLRLRAWSAGQHDGGRIAVDISNACELKWALRYTPPRPRMTQLIHGAPVTWLAPYPAQVASLAALVRLLCEVVGIPPVVPLRPDGTADLRLLDPVPDGVIGHLHCQRDSKGRPAKFDPFGLDWPAFQALVRPAAREHR